MRLQNQVVIVTGAGSAIGRCLAIKMVAEGARVVITARTRADLEETARLADGPGQTLIVPGDVTDAVQTRQLAATTLERWGRIDALVNNAGSFYCLGPVAEVDPEAWWWDVTVNLKGSFLGAQAVLPAMLQQGSGCILNLTGGGAGNPLPYGSGYASSKCALFRLTECLAAEVREQGVRVFLMSPGFVRSRLTEYHVYSEEGRRYLPTMQNSFEEGRDQPPDIAAERAIRLIADGPMELTGRFVGDQPFTAEAIAAALEADRGMMRIT
ncbi:MAG: SDR family oxidoreductase [Armatimonadetes bacterium]|nr:SDR family oxidoreductase [Armatimonadota bacterium]